MFHIEKNNSNIAEMYNDVFEYAKALMFDERDMIANLANISAMLNSILDNVNWVGFYIVKGDELVLGPFQGKAACIRIKSDKGVCGTALETKSTMLVKNIREFKGHIACDGDSNSEIVVPIIFEGEVIAVLDIDSPVLGRFNETDKENLEQLCEIISRSCDW